MLPFSLCKPNACAFFVPELLTWRSLLNFCPFQSFSFNFSSRFTITNSSDGFDSVHLNLQIFWHVWSRCFLVPSGLSPISFLYVFTGFSVFPLILETLKGPLPLDHHLSVFLSLFFCYHPLGVSSAPVENVHCICTLVCLPQRASAHINGLNQPFYCDNPNVFISYPHMKLCSYVLSWLWTIYTWISSVTSHSVYWEFSKLFSCFNFSYSHFCQY